jgi:hypothetical protein
MRVRHPLLVAAAGASVAASALADVLERGSHFSHLVALALVAAVVVVAHAGLTGSVRGALPTTAVACGRSRSTRRTRAVTASRT